MSVKFRPYVAQILDLLANRPQSEVVVHRERRINAADFAVMVHRLAHALVECGTRPRTTVTLLTSNRPETIAVRYAANLVGCRVNHLYGQLSSALQATIMRDVETRVLVVDSEHHERAAELVNAAPAVTVVTLGIPPGTGIDLLQLARHMPDEPIRCPARPDDIATIRHTGGTTGRPKAVCLSFGTVAGKLRVSPIPESARRRFLVCTSLAHAASQGVDRTLSSAGTAVLHDGFDARRVLETVQRERITHLYVLPPLLYRLVDEPCQADTGSLRELYYMGTPASPTRLVEAVHRFGPVLRQIYGQTECGNISVLDPADHDPRRPELLRTAGRVLPGVEVSIRDQDGNDLAPGERGEIWVRSDSVMDGYWKQPDLTAGVLRDGWLRTGDVGTLDRAGYVTLVGRLSEKIIVAGGHVYPAEVEQIMSRHPRVSQCAVLGVRGRDAVEHIHAVVVPVPGCSIDGAELQGLVRRELGSLYVPEDIAFRAGMPLTEAGKPDKALLREHIGH